jgi:hypothetical protein
VRLEILRVGSKGALVEAVQLFLRGTDMYQGPVDGDFGPKTKAAVLLWQDHAKLCTDGAIGNNTWGSLMAAGLVLLEPDDAADDETGANWPPRPLFPSLNAAQRANVFGSLVTEPNPIAGNPENCRIVTRGFEYRIVQVELPKLIGRDGFPGNGKVLFHAKGARMLQTLVDSWDSAGLLNRVLGWAGSLAVRYVRGSRTTLSPHAWGTAFDINVPWNGLGREPALKHRKGSVRELVTIANEQGWYWGGHLTRRDGMHFEVAEVRNDTDPAPPPESEGTP